MEISQVQSENPKRSEHGWPQSILEPLCTDIKLDGRMLPHFILCSI